MSSTNMLKSVVLLALLTALLLFVGEAVAGEAGLVLALLLAVSMNAASYWWSDKIALSMSHAREVDPSEAPELHAIVDEVAYASGVPKPRVYIMENPSPNAFATGRDPRHAAIAVTTGILEVLDTRELRGVLAHELAHVKNRDTLIATIVATIAGAISMIGQMAQWALLFGGVGRRGGNEEGRGVLGGLFAVIVAPIIAMLVQTAISRAREFEADATGANFSHDPLALADALERLEEATAIRPMVNANPAAAHLFIVNPFGGLNIGHLLSTHPPVAERVKRLRQMAGSPR